MLVYNTTANAQQLLCKGMNLWNGIEWQCLVNTARFSIDCSSITPKGVYRINEPLDPQKHYILMDILLEEAAIGGIYHLKTEIIDGISFEGKGVIESSGRQTIRLEGTGTPLNTKTKHYTISSNSVTSSQKCGFDLYIVIPQKRILSLGTENRALHQNSGGGTGTIFNNPLNFGTLEESTFRIETPIIHGFNISSIRVSDLQPYIAPTDGSQPVDIVFITYNADLVATDNNAAGKLLVEYVKQGGVVIYNNEHMFNHNGGAPGKFIQDLFGSDTNIWGKEDVASGGWIYKLPDYDDIILNGPFGDLRGAYVGEDGCCGDVFTYLPASEIEWSFSSFDYSGLSGGSLDQISGFKAKNYNLFWCGDGGIGSGNNTPYDRSSFPVLLDSENRPISKTYGRGSVPQLVENARFVANLFCWAFQQAEFNGINTPKE